MIYLHGQWPVNYLYESLSEFQGRTKQSLYYQQHKVM